MSKQCTILSMGRAAGWFYNDHKKVVAGKREMNMQKFRCKRASGEDLELLVPLFDQYRVFYNQASEPDRAQAFLEERLKLEESVLFLAVEEDGETRRAAGFTQLYPSFSSVPMQRLWILNDLFVHASFRGAGIGSLLLESAHDFALESGSKGLTLTTWTGNVVAQRLYEARGYIRDEDFYTYNLFF